MNRRLRVLFVIGSMGGGGAERQVLEYLRRLDRSRFEVSLYLAHRQGEFLADVPGDVHITSFWENFPRWLGACLVTGTTRIMRWRHLARVLRERQIDVVYDRTFLATLDAGPATWRRRTLRLSAVAADPAVQMDLYFPQRQWLCAGSRGGCIERQVLLANSAGLRQQVIDYFQLPPEQVRLLTNVLDVVRIENLAAEPLPNADSDSSRFRILTVGRIDRHKGHRDLLQAVRILVQDRHRTNLLWTILGDGPEREPLLAEAERLGLAKHVEWRGIVANPFPYYRAADLFCLPSLTEGSPNVLIEALALGTPVISTDCPSGPREILEDGKWGVLTPLENPAALAAAIADRIDNPQAWLERAAVARLVSHSRYDAAAGVRQLEELLIEVAAGR